jgi:ribosomal protein S18 acetylase RimI-like enzyme
MDIEPPTTDEVDELADLWVALARDQRRYGSRLLAPENRDHIRDSIAHHVVAGGILVARDPGVVGFVMFAPEAGQYEQDAVRGVVQNIYVQPDRRGEGIGSALLERAESMLAAAGIEVVTLDAMAENEAARRFYRRHGYDVHRVELEKRVENDNNSKEET